MFIDLHSGEKIKNYLARKRSVLPIRYDGKGALKLEYKEENGEQEFAQEQVENENYDDIEFLTAEFHMPIKIERETFEDFDDINFLLCDENPILPTPFKFKQETDINEMEDLIILCDDDYLLPKPIGVAIKREIEDDGHEAIPMQGALPEPEQGNDRDENLDMDADIRGQADAISGLLPFEVKVYTC